MSGPVKPATSLVSLHALISGLPSPIPPQFHLNVQILPLKDSNFLRILLVSLHNSHKLLTNLIILPILLSKALGQILIILLEKAILFYDSMNVLNLLLEIFLQGIDLISFMFQFKFNLAVTAIQGS